jgi:uncharacterized protein YkwD
MEDLRKTSFQKSMSITHKPYQKYLSLIGVFVAIFSFGYASTTFAIDAITSDRVVELVNESRLAHDMPIVAISRDLGAAASLKARDMFAKQYFAHNTPDGKMPWYWINLVGYEYVMAGENLAIHFTDALSQHTAWMESPLHRKNILNPEYRDIGVAVERGMFQGKETTIVVQFFGTQKILPPAATFQSESSIGSETSPLVESESISYDEPEKTTTGVIGRLSIALGYELLHAILPTILVLPFFVLSFSFLRNAYTSTFFFLNRSKLSDS